MNILYMHYFIIHSVMSLEKFLQFVKNDEVNDRKSVYELDQIPLNIDAFQTNQILIKYIQYIPEITFPNINFFCHVKQLEQGCKINAAYLCKKDILLANDDCHFINKETKKVKFDDIEFEIKFDSTFGVTVILNMEIVTITNRSKPFDGFYFCKLSNPLGSITSNYIEFQDYEFYKKKLVNLIRPFTKSYQVTPINDITSTSFPIYLDCGKAIGNYDKYLPKWINQRMLMGFDWVLCPSMKSGVACYTSMVDTKSKKSHTLDDFMNYYQFANGTIILMDMRSSDYIKSGLMCLAKSSTNKPYAIYLVQEKSGWRPINYVYSGPHVKKIQELSPTNNTIVIREGLFQTSRFKLSVAYVANTDHTKVSTEWKKDNYNLPAIFEQGPYKLTFPIEITEAHSGTYVLKIMQSEPYDSATFSFTVKVIGPPKLKKIGEFSPILYRTVDQTVNISVSFEKNIIRKNIEINGIKIDFSSEINKNKSSDNLVFNYPFLTGIDIRARFDFDNDPGLIQYEARNLMTSMHINQPKTHTVSFKAENDVGISQVSYLIRVFETPIFTSYLSDFNCTDKCNDNEQHEFKCSIDTGPYLSEGCTIEYLWKLNHLSLNTMNEHYDQKMYFQLFNDTIILKPIKSDNAAKDKRMINILTDATLSCQIEIYEPVRSGVQSTRKLYSTENYPHLKSWLEAKIQLQVYSIDTAGTSWILPLVISLIIIVILIVLILYFCLRSTGETYNVDQKERAHGHDPEKEIRENETFQLYERDHETVGFQSSHLSFNDEDSVGVGSDDGELDLYEIDPGKFNEEGSFIGQYASDPRRTKPNNV